MLDRRAFLGATLLAATVSGCSSTANLLDLGRTVRVAVSWSGMELEAFRSAIADLKIDDYRVELVPFGDEIGAAFRTTPRPDIVMLPQPGLVQEYLDELAPLPSEIIKPWPDTPLWPDMLFLDKDDKDDKDGVRHWYGLPFKIANKSAVWYRKSVFTRHHVSPPGSWSSWLQLNKTLAQRHVTPLALAGADGWMLSDFFENVLLSRTPEVYEAIVAEARADSNQVRLFAEPKASAIRGALELLGEMWSPSNTLVGGAEYSSVLQFYDAVVEVFGYGRAAMVVAPDFAEPIVRSLLGDRGEDVGIFPFPLVDDASALGGGGAKPPVVVGGDVVVLLRNAGDNALDLVRRLSGPQAPQHWIRRYGGFLAANRPAEPAGYSDELQKLAERLSGDLAASVSFDLSDQLGRLGGSEGLWRILQDFLRRVGGRGANTDVAAAAEKSIRQLQGLAG